MKKTTAILMALLLLFTACAAFAEESWTCPGCGRSDLNTNYCPDCGFAKNGAGRRCEGAGYATAQEAALAYVEAINGADVERAVSTFAVESYIDHCDPREFLLYYKALMPDSYSSVPVAGPLSEGLLCQKRRNEIVDWIYNMYITYSVDATDYARLAQRMTVPVKEEAEADAFLRVMSPSLVEQLCGKITVTGVFLPDNPVVRAMIPDAYFTERIQQNIEKYRVMRGADELQDVIVVLNAGGLPCVQFMWCIRYGERWYNYSPINMTALLLSMSVLTGGLAPLNMLITQ